jgi:hypothetical protein
MESGEGPFLKKGLLPPKNDHTQRITTNDELGFFLVSELNPISCAAKELKNVS